MENGKKNQLVTQEDLELFKQEMLSAMRQLLLPVSGPPVKRWVKSNAARKMIGVSPGKLQVIRDSGLLTFTRIGGNIYYDLEELNQLFENHKVEKRK